MVLYVQQVHTFYKLGGDLNPPYLQQRENTFPYAYRFLPLHSYLYAQFNLLQ